MRNISARPELRQLLPDLVLGIIECRVKPEKKNDRLVQELIMVSSSLQMGLSGVSSHPAIQASRKAYKILGKDPARYRLSAEALMRRAIKGLDLPQVNNIVDLINLVSVQTGISIGGYDAEKINGNIVMDIGKKNDEYTAIGRGIFNIENLPVLRDDTSAFGSPTSDAERTSVNLDTKSFLMVFFGFSGEEDTRNAMEFAVELLVKYAGATGLDTRLLRSV